MSDHMEMMVSLIKWPTLPMSSTYFPFNPSLEDEIKRLFDNCALSNTNEIEQNVEDVMEEFRHNGRDFEYCPDLDLDANKQITPRRKKNKKSSPTECVFCRNNGEEETYYQQHLLRDVKGRIQCPVLRKYTCPICGACGDTAHTIKYCPEGPYSPNSISTANAFKLLRNSVGKRRGKKDNKKSDQTKSQEPASKDFIRMREWERVDTDSS